MENNYMTRYKYYPNTKIFRELYPKGELIDGKIRVKISYPNLYTGVFIAPQSGHYRVSSLDECRNTIVYEMDKEDILLLGSKPHTVIKEV